jgi:ribosomal-protein-alanine N-acetyltransferase
MKPSPDDVLLTEVDLLLVRQLQDDVSALSRKLEVRQRSVVVSRTGCRNVIESLESLAAQLRERLAQSPVDPAAKPVLRWLIRRDMPEVLAIEQRCFPAEIAWEEHDFIDAMRQRNCSPFVAEVNERVVGFFLYTLERQQLELLNIAVDPDWQRKGIGRAMLDKLRGKLTASAGRCNRLVTTVREHNLPAQQFFKACGFRHQSTIKEGSDLLGDDWAVIGGDAYRMAFTLESPVVRQPAEVRS